MDSGYYAATAGLIARTQALDTIANNLANASTTGFRASHNIFRSMLAGNDGTDGANLSVVNQDANDYGVLGGTQLDTSQGALIETGNDLDLAMEGPGYFQVQTASGTEYTRGGSFRVSPAGQLVTAAGDTVLGDNGPISIVGQPVSISGDGTITINGAIAGHLKQVEFPAGTQIESAGKGYFSAPAAAAVPATQSNVRQGKLESSNVNPLNSVIELINAQREFESMRQALSMFSAQMDKTAVTELPRIG